MTRCPACNRYDDGLDRRGYCRHCHEDVAPESTPAPNAEQATSHTPPVSHLSQVPLPPATPCAFCPAKDQTISELQTRYAELWSEASRAAPAGAALPFCKACLDKDHTVAELKRRLEVLDAQLHHLKVVNPVRSRRMFWGTLLSGASWLVGFLLVSIALMINVESCDLRGSKRTPLLFTNLALIGGVPLLVVVYRYGLRLQSLGADELMALDARAPVLMLRAFEDDSRLAVAGRPTSLWVFGVNALPLELKLTRWLSQVGPVFAIGRPGEPLPPLGASRLYVPNALWKEKVNSYLRQCRFVVMVLGRAGGNDGLNWEVKRLFGSEVQDGGYQVPPERVVLLVLPLDEAEVADRWEQVRSLSGGKLPAYQGGELVVGFSPKWEHLVIRTPGTRSLGTYLWGLSQLKVLGEMARGSSAPTGDGAAYRQVVGQNCKWCGLWIGSAQEAGFCRKCGSAFHTGCSRLSECDGGHHDLQVEPE